MNTRVGTVLLGLLLASAGALGFTGMTTVSAAVARSFFPVAALIFVITSAVGIVVRFRT
ncbi:MAG: hypothetical protein WA755_18910 [Candidatus Acidiferrales bacterium]